MQDSFASGSSSARQDVNIPLVKGEDGEEMDELESNPDESFRPLAEGYLVGASPSPWKGKQRETFDAGQEGEEGAEGVTYAEGHEELELALGIRLSSRLPIVGDTFPSDYAIRSQVSFASYSRGYRFKLCGSPGPGNRFILSLICSRRDGAACHVGVRAVAENRKTGEGTWTVTASEWGHSHPPETFPPWYQPTRQRKPNVLCGSSPPTSLPGNGECIVSINDARATAPRFPRLGDIFSPREAFQLAYRSAHASNGYNTAVFQSPQACNGFKTYMGCSPAPKAFVPGACKCKTVVQAEDSKTGEGVWTVIQVVDEHNHPPPSRLSRATRLVSSGSGEGRIGRFRAVKYSEVGNEPLDDVEEHVGMIGGGSLGLRSKPSQKRPRDRSPAVTSTSNLNQDRHVRPRVVNPQTGRATSNSISPRAVESFRQPLPTPPLKPSDHSTSSKPISLALLTTFLSRISPILATSSRFLHGSGIDNLESLVALWSLPETQLESVLRQIGVKMARRGIPGFPSLHCTILVKGILASRA